MTTQTPDAVREAIRAEIAKQLDEPWRDRVILRPDQWKVILAALDSRAGDAGDGLPAGPDDCMWRSGHDGNGPDPTRFFCEVIGPAPSCNLYRAVADTEAEARALAFRKADPLFSATGSSGANDAVGPVERALWAIADTALQDFVKGDPGKRVDSLIPTPEWKEMRKACDRRGLSISLFVRLAIRHHLTWLAAYRSPAELEDGFSECPATSAPAVDALTALENAMRGKTMSWDFHEGYQQAINDMRKAVQP